MTHTDFNQLLSSLAGLSPDQVLQLRQPLDKELAPPSTTPARTSANSRPCQGRSAAGEEADD